MNHHRIRDSCLLIIVPPPFPCRSKLAQVGTEFPVEIKTLLASAAPCYFLCYTVRYFGIPCAAAPYHLSIPVKCKCPPVPSMHARTGHPETRCFCKEPRSPLSQAQRALLKSRTERCSCTEWRKPNYCFHTTKGLARLKSGCVIEQRQSVEERTSPDPCCKHV